MTASNFKEWLWSAKVLTTIVWIIFPLAYIAFFLILNLPRPAVEGEGTFLDILLGPLIFSTADELANALGIFSIIVLPPIPFAIVLLLFSVYPAIYPTEKFFKKRGSVNAIIEYQDIRKILFAFLIASVIVISTFYFYEPYYVKQENRLIEQFNNQQGNVTEQIINLENQGMTFEDASSHPSLNELRNQISITSYQFEILNFLVRSLYIIAYVLPTVPIFILLKMLLEHARKQFRFFYAKACIEIVTKTKNEPDKAECLFRGLDWYNKFVKRVTKNAIDVETIYSKVISLSPLNNNILLDTILDSFHGGDELKPMRHILALLSCWKEGGATLVKESLRTKIRESSDLLIPIVTIIITIITTFFLKSPITPGT